MATKSISQLDTQATANESDLFEVAIADAHSASGCASKKESAAVIAEGIVNQYTYPLGMPHMQNKTILGAINQLLANFAAVYDDTATYSEEDFRTYNGQLYKCNTDISTAETFDPTKWDAVTLADNLGSGGGGGGIDYSTTEQDTGLKWIDGKSIYQKTIELSITTSSANSFVTTGVSIATLSIDILINGQAYDTGGQSYPANLGKMGTLGAETIGIALGVANRNITAITIQYTKTTD